LRLSNYPTEDSADSVRVALADLAGASSWLRLNVDAVHVWFADLNRHSADDLKQLLAADEIARADRFRFARDRNHYIVARAILRTLLAAYSGSAAHEVQFGYAEKGKPSLSAAENNLLNFNLAHSHGKVVYAFALGRALGIDLEFVREDFAGEDIADRFFSRAEIAALRNIPADLRKQAFFNCWTRKEAYIKARGEGLSMPLDAFDVSLEPGQPALFLRNHQEPGEVERWCMRALSAPDGYVAALVVEGQSWELKSFTID
jgi:4'-phosphopantetheinyl transferase